MFVVLLQNLEDAESKEEALEELASLRANCMIEKAVSQFNMSVEEAIQMIKTEDDGFLTQNERDKKNRLVIALDNIIEFCTCAEYQAMKEVEEIYEEDDIDFDDIDLEDMPDDEEEDDDENPLMPYWRVNKRYNGTYRNVEEADAAYAMLMCDRWLRYADEEVLTYMTQNDDRVRPWHYALQGFTAPKKDFPAWMIPPIEWRCRCFLITSSGEVFAKSSSLAPRKPKEVDGVFSESICTGGRIFSDKHHYFDIDKNDKPMLVRIINDIKEGYYGS